MNGKTKSLVGAAIGCLSLAGCAAHRVPTASENLASASVVDRAIEESAALIHKDLQQLQSLRTASAPAHPHHKTPTKGPLAQKVTMRFTGEPHAVVKTIAQLIGYDYKTVGKTPTPPRIVEVDSTAEPAFKILEDVALQLGNGVGVGVDPQQRLLTVDYHGID